MTEHSLNLAENCRATLYFVCVCVVHHGINHMKEWASSLYQMFIEVLRLNA